MSKKKRTKRDKADHEAREWKDILGADVKAALDAKAERSELRGTFSPAATLYWQSRLHPAHTHRLLAVARSIRDKDAVIDEFVDDRNERRRKQVAKSSKAGRKSREDALSWTNADYTKTWVAAVHKAGGPWKRGAKRQGDNAVLRVKVKDKRLPKSMDERQRKNALDAIARYMRNHVGTMPWKDVIAEHRGDVEAT
jgi:hypothetical protein